MIKKISSVLNYSAALGLLIFGVIYLTKSTFMHYHSQAISLDWNGLEQNTQTLIIALMRTIGGGFIGSSVAIIVLQYKFYSQATSWAPLLILVIGAITYGNSIFAQIGLRINTPGEPPTLLSIIEVLILVIAFILNQVSIRSLN